MNFNLVITLTARQNTINAYNYYESIRAELGEDFLYELETKYRSIRQNPYSFSYIDDKFILRDCALNRFPFVVIYKIHEEQIFILSVHNFNKNPFSV